MEIHESTLYRWMDGLTAGMALEDLEFTQEVIWELRDALGLPNDTDGRA